MAAIVFGASAAWWVGFLYSDSCREAGGIIEDGVCVGAGSSVEWLWEAPWQRIAFNLLPPAVLTGLLAIAAWIVSLSGKRSDV